MAARRKKQEWVDDGRVIAMNEVAETLTGWSEAEAMGRMVTEVFSILRAKTRKEEENPVWQALAERRAVASAHDIVLIARDGAERRIADRCAPVQDAYEAVVGAVLVLHERVRWPQMLALLIGFVGVLVVVRPDMGAPDWNLLYAFASALALAAVMLLLKASADREDARRVTWLNLVLSVPLAGLMCLPFWSGPAPLDLAIMAIQGIGGVLAQLSVSAAMRMSRASVLIIVDFIRLPLAIGAGVLLFGESLDGPIVAGAALILASLLLNGLVASRHRDVVAPPG